MKKIIMLLCITLIVLLTSCSNNVTKTFETGYVGSISVKENSEYKQTVKELYLGELIDYELTIINGQHTWTEVIIEKYTIGNSVPERIGGISMGKGIADAPRTKSLSLLFGKDQVNHQFYINTYLDGGAAFGDRIDELKDGAGNLLGHGMVSAIGSEPIDLMENEEIIIGYITFNNQFRGYDLTNEAELKALLEDNQHAILIKLKLTKI